VSLTYPYNLANGTSRHLELWEIATGKCLSSMKPDRYFDEVRIGGDGISIIIEDKGKTERWSISPNQSTDDDDKDDQSSFPMKFVPLHDAHQPVPTRFHHYRPWIEWIVDERERRVLWVPPDMRFAGDSYGKKVVFGALSGLVPIVVQ
jgi:hypothetical protein